MEDFVNDLNRHWTAQDPVVLAAHALWRMNHIHPFINGNGRTARAASYFVLCVSAGGWLPGTPILPELIKANRPAYVAALQHADSARTASGAPDLSQLHALLTQLLAEQIGSAVPSGGAGPTSAPPTPPPPP
jgi:Fic family protein